MIIKYKPYKVDRYRHLAFYSKKKRIQNKNQKLFKDQIIAILIGKYYDYQ